MNLIKSQDFFNPLSVKGRCHIIGCGSVGSTLAELLARLGITEISLYDFDTVSSHNLANQMFTNSDIDRLKVEAVKDLICSINPEIEKTIKIYDKGYTKDTTLSGYVFLCVDNIDLRRHIATENRFNPQIKAMFDFRTRLVDMQCYAADWSNPAMIDNLIKSMDFSHEEAHESTPVTACNVEMSVAPTIRIGCSYGIANFMNYINGLPLKKIILIDAFNFEVESY